MIGLVVNIGLLLIASDCWKKSRAGRRRADKIGELEELAKKREAKCARLHNLLGHISSECEALLSERHRQWSTRVAATRDATTALQQQLGEQLRGLEEELGQMRRLTAEAGLQRIEELEDQRFLLRQQITVREAKTLELRNAGKELAGPRG